MELVLIEWIDSAFMQGWMLKDKVKEHTISRIASVGILIHEDAEKITIVQDVSNKDDAADGITIPKCCIKRIRKLRVR